jgi:hypothetical protein
MSSEDAVLWLVAGVVGTAVAGYVWRLAVRFAAQRARRLRYQRMGQASGPQRLAAQPGGFSSSMGPAQAAAIRRDAERAAALFAAGKDAEPRAPYAGGTPEFVLWVATYHLTLHELADEAPADPAPNWQPTRPAADGDVNRP